MRNLRLKIYLTYFFLGLSANADSQENILGTWNISLDIQGQLVLLDLKLSDSNGDLIGEFGAPEIGHFPIQNVAFDGLYLTFEADDLQGSTAKVNLRLEGAELEGNVVSPVLGDMSARGGRM